MDILQNYARGVNLGGWISQYEEYDKHHFETFIEERDIAQIASFGCDHVRLPFDYPLFLTNTEPYELLEEGFGYVDACIGWCRKHGLNIVLDMHAAPGYSFGDFERSTLFTDETQQQAYMNLWRAFAKRYMGERDNVIFELLNEIVEPDSTRWNKLAKRAMEAIWQADPGRYIILGGNRYNSVDELKNLDIIDNPHLLYTFHFYKPMFITHQLASWTPEMIEYGRNTEYPGQAVGILEFNKTHNNYFEPGDEDFIDKAALDKRLAPAYAFAQKTGKRLYCGEFGVIEKASLPTRIRYLKDLTDLFRQHGISYAMWSYKEMGFPLVDIHSKPVSDELTKAVLG